jgi:ribosomal protein S18 acetylase RimI-like enzyme
MQNLIDAVKDAAHRGGAIYLRLYVHGKNERAIKAYHKVGFSESGYRIMQMGF